MATFRKDFQGTVEQIERTNLALEEFKMKYSQLLKNNDGVKKKLNEINITHELLKTSIEKLQKELTIEKYVALQEKLALVYNHKDFRYLSLPSQVKEDGKDLTITLEPRGENSTLPKYSSTLRIPDKKNSFWGVFTGLYYAKNLNENYSTTKRDTIEENPLYEPLEEGEEENSDRLIEKSYYTLVKERGMETEVGFKAMVLIGWELTPERLPNVYFTVGLGGGLSINEKPKPRLFLAPGIAIGNKNKLTFDIGGVYMFYDVLSEAYNTNTEYNAQPVNYLVTDSQIRIYYSVGYTISLDGD